MMTPFEKLANRVALRQVRNISWREFVSFMEFSRYVDHATDVEACFERWGAYPTFCADCKDFKGFIFDKQKATQSAGWACLVCPLCDCIVP